MKYLIRRFAIIKLENFQNEVFKTLKIVKGNNIEIDDKIYVYSNEIFKTVSPKYVYKELIFDENYKIINSNFILEGNNIKKHLTNCFSLIISIETLGIEFDTKMRTLQFTDILDSVIYDCCGNILIENYKDQIETQIKDVYKKNNLFLTKGYSPGYGDFPISSQKDIVNLLDATKKIGVYVNETNLLIPKKTITSILGISNKKVTGVFASCEDCKIYDNCQKRLGGYTCAME